MNVDNSHQMGSTSKGALNRWFYFYLPSKLYLEIILSSINNLPWLSGLRCQADKLQDPGTIPRLGFNIFCGCTKNCFFAHFLERFITISEVALEFWKTLKQAWTQLKNPVYILRSPRILKQLQKLL